MGGVYPSPRAPPPHIDPVKFVFKDPGGYIKRMRLPWRKSKKAEKAAAQEREPSGKFAAPVAQIQQKAVEQEAKSVSTLVETLKGVQELNRMMGVGEEVAEESIIGSEWAPVAQMGLQIFGPALVPYIDGIMERLGIPKNAIVDEKPSEAVAASPQSPAGLQGIGLIKQAAVTSPKLIKIALKTKGYSELEKLGVTEEEFKQGITNIHKAIG